MRNRHLAEWRFSLFIRIVTTYPRICNVIVIGISTTSLGGCSQPPAVRAAPCYYRIISSDKLQHLFHPTRGERSNAAFSNQSAAKLPSHAPHGSKARLRVVSNSRSSWRSHVHRTLTEQRVQSFKLQSANVGGRGARPLVFFSGFRGDTLSRKRVSPLLRTPAARREQSAEHRAAKNILPFSKEKERLFRGVLLILRK